MSSSLQWRHNGHNASQITSPTFVYSSVYSDADQGKHQSSASLAFVREIHQLPVNSPHKWPITREFFHLMTSSRNAKFMRLIGYHFHVMSWIRKQARPVTWLFSRNLSSSCKKSANRVSGYCNHGNHAKFLLYGGSYATCSWSKMNNGQIFSPKSRKIMSHPNHITHRTSNKSMKWSLYLHILFLFLNQDHFNPLLDYFKYLDKNWIFYFESSLLSDAVN